MIDETKIPSREENEPLFQHFLNAAGGPAYARRSRQVEGTWIHILEKCQTDREEMLAIPRLRIGMVKARAGEWGNLSVAVSSAQLEVLQELHQLLKPHLRAPIRQTTVERKLRKEIKNLQDSITRFNDRWLEYVDVVDLSFLNELREKYNRFYVLEKECAIRSPRLARLGFEPLAPLSSQDLLDEMPLLPTLD